MVKEPGSKTVELFSEENSCPVTSVKIGDTASFETLGCLKELQKIMIK
jgi:hypothetical protein